MAAPPSPPTRACPDDDGRPSHQVSRFHPVAPASPAPTTATIWVCGTVTILPMVSATAVPSRTAPAMLKTADSATACPGVAPRVATSVAIAFDASWKPLVSAKDAAKPMAMKSATSTEPPASRLSERALNAQ